MLEQLVKRLAYNSRRLYRRWTGSLRLLPDFIIIGGQKCGTTSLYHYLNQHPQVHMSHGKELHYFDLNFDKGQTWYRTQFPLASQKTYAQQIKKTHFLTGESSPYYMFHPHTPRRMAEMLPEVKLIVLLRNPIDRAYSHYYHQVKKKRETLPFAEAIDREAEWLTQEMQKILADEYYYSYNHHHLAYLARSIYIDQLLYWEKFFERCQMLVLNSEMLFSNPTATFDQVLDFLGLSRWYPPAFKQHNVNTYPNIDPTTRHWLQDYFALPNQRLFKYLGAEFDW